MEKENNLKERKIIDLYLIKMQNTITVILTCVCDYT